MKTALLIALLFLPTFTFAYDWEEEESGQVEREIQVTRNRNYPGGADEQDLKVQKSLAQASRSPETQAELIKRDDAEVDDHSND